MMTLILLLLLKAMIEKDVSAWNDSSKRSLRGQESNRIGECEYKIMITDLPRERGDKTSAAADTGAVS
jgi:hypothetical protein